MVILKLRLGILVFSERKDMAVTLLKPGRLDDTATLEVITCGEVHGVRATQPANGRIGEPGPDRPENRYQCALSVSWRHVDEETFDVAFRDSLKMGRDRLEMEAIHKRRTRFDDRPSISHKQCKVPPGPLCAYRFRRKRG